MKIEKIKIDVLKLPFKQKFTHALKSREQSINIIIQIYSKNKVGIGESLPREYVTGENVNSVLDYLENIIKKFEIRNFENFEESLDFLIEHSKKLKKNELSAFGCFSDAFLNLICQEFNKGIEDVLEYLNINIEKKNKIIYTAILGDKPTFLMYIKAFEIARRKFNQIKIKTSPYTFKKLKLISKILKKQEVRIDGNCSFNLTEIKKYLSDMKNENVVYFEQPYSTTYNKKEEISNLLEKNNIKIIHDEDFCSFEDIKKFEKYGHIASIRINKNGGIINSLLIYKELKKRNIPCLLNCLVGETVLTRYNIILGKYLKTLGNEGNYDNYLFKNPIIQNPKFDEDGTLTNINFDLNQEIKLNSNYSNFILTKNNFNF